MLKKHYVYFGPSGMFDDIGTKCGIRIKIEKTERFTTDVSEVTCGSCLKSARKDCIDFRKDIMIMLETNFDDFCAITVQLGKLQIAKIFKNKTKAISNDEKKR